MREIYAAIERFDAALDRLERALSRKATPQDPDGAIERLRRENETLRAARREDASLRIAALQRVDVAIAALEAAIVAKAGGGEGRAVPMRARGLFGDAEARARAVAG